MIDVASVGILVADVMAKPIDSIPKKGLLKLVDSIELFTGGNAMTAAINIKKMGLNSAIIGKVGNDFFGEYLIKSINNYDISAEGVKVDDNIQTSSSIALSATDGERTFLHCIGANGVFSINDIDWNTIKDSKIVFVTGTFLLETFDGEQTKDFLKKCKDMGKITALDVCWDSNGRWGDIINMAMPYIDYFIPSIEEAIEISKCNIPEEISNVFISNGVKNVVIKMGKDGCFIKNHLDKTGRKLNTYSNIKRIDSTGAGDSFCSGFLACLAKGGNLLECAQFANATGSISIMYKGATTWNKTYDEVIEFMKENEYGLQ